MQIQVVFLNDLIITLVIIVVFWIDFNGLTKTNVLLRFEVRAAERSIDGAYILIANVLRCCSWSTQTSNPSPQSVYFESQTWLNLSNLTPHGRKFKKYGKYKQISRYFDWQSETSRNRDVVYFLKFVAFVKLSHLRASTAGDDVLI